ncbi:putative transcriptional regulatory protein [Iris pallida]|uniref:Transcriptional regulatory protein n=1 Tax=Iris pallida TaxID=29817 RepID=A0AAX6H3N2_IRIPA|nr:putative transcriptional regulatory protein [Iris pallida]
MMEDMINDVNLFGRRLMLQRNFSSFCRHSMCKVLWVYFVND